MSRERSLIIRLYPEELAVFHRAARPSGLVVSSWARNRLLQAARAEITKEAPPDTEDSAERKCA